MHTLTIVPPASIKSFERQLLSTTALTPTHHKGGIGKILGFAAAIAVPFAAPAIASAIGVSSVLGQAMVGAGLGAVTSLATGGDPLRGALMGGITAGIGGAMRGAPGIGGSATQTMTGPELFGGGGDAFTGVDTFTSAFPNTTGAVSALPGTATAQANALDAWNQLPGAGGLQGTANAQTAALDAWNQLPGTGVTPGAQLSGEFGVPETAFDGAVPDNVWFNNPGAEFVWTDGAPGGTLPIQPAPGGTDSLFRSAFLEDPQYIRSAGNYGGGVRPAGVLDSSLVNTPFDPNYGKFQSDFATSAYTPTAASTASAPAAGLATNMQQAGSTLSNLGSRGLEAFKGLSDPVKTALIQAGTSQIGSLLAGDEPEMSDAEKEALEYRKRMLAQQEAMLKKQEDVGMSLMNQANRIDPVFRGRQALVEEQNRLARAQARGLRGTNNREATLRRNALDMARTGAFSRGFQEAEARKQDATQRAAGALPNYAGLATAGANDAKSSAEYFDRLKDERKNAGDMIQPILQQVAFGRSKEDMEKDRKRISGLIGS